jgi:hypothetical protein
MAPRKFPSDAGTVIATQRDFTVDAGEVLTYTHSGAAADVLADYGSIKANAEASTETDLASMSYAEDRGRGTLIRRYVRPNKAIEELYGTDVIKDILTSAYFADLTDAEVAAVRAEYEKTGGGVADVSWNQLQKNLHTHLLRGEESFTLTQFILRVTNFCVRSSQINASFEDCNRVVPGIVLSPDMAALVNSLPTGEWLKKPPQVESLGRGRWRVTYEYHWSEKWSVVYGGTWGIAP